MTYLGTLSLEHSSSLNKALLCGELWFPQVCVDRSTLEVYIYVMYVCIYDMQIECNTQFHFTLWLCFGSNLESLSGLNASMSLYRDFSLPMKVSTSHQL